MEVAVTQYMIKCKFTFILCLVYCIGSYAQGVNTESKNSYIIVNSAYAFPEKSTISGYILRKLYGENFNKFVDIEKDRESFFGKRVWFLNNTAEYFIRSDFSKLCGEKPQILNIALSMWFNPVIDSLILDNDKPDSLELNRDKRFVLIVKQNDTFNLSISSDTIALYYENTWCRAFKYLVIQHIFSIIMGEGGEFDKKCLSKDGSQEANLLILGDDKDYLPISKKIAESLFDKWEYKKTMIGSEYFYPAFLYLWNTELDTIAGQYYNEYLKLNEK